MGAEASPLTRQPGTFWSTAACVAVLVIGSVGPWATAGVISVAGTDGDGVITLILALAAGAALVRYATAGDRRALVGAAVCGAVSAAIGVYDFVEIQSQGGELLSLSPGWGLYLTVISSVGLAGTAVVLRE